MKKDVDFKENKKECLIEVIDILDESEAVDTIITEKILAEVIKMISVNLFRTFSNKGKQASFQFNRCKSEQKDIFC